MGENQRPEGEEQGSAEQIPTQPAQPIAKEEVPQEIQQEPQQIAQPTEFYVPKKDDVTEIKPTKWQKFKDFVVECQRVIRVTKKPDKMEFKTIVKISGIGMAVIGFLGFFVHFVKELIF